MHNVQRPEEFLKEAESVSRELFEIRENIKRLKDKLNDLHQELIKLRDEKSKLLQEIRAIRERIRTLRNDRAKLIEEYRKVVKERGEIIRQLKALRELISDKQKRSQELLKEVKIPVSALKQKIRDIEWTLQTSTLTLEEENKLIEKLRTYSSLLNKALAAKKSEEEVLELRALYLSLRSRIQELSKKCNEFKRAMGEKTNAINELKVKLDGTVSSYTEVKRVLESKKREISNCIYEISQLSSKLSLLREKYQELLRSAERAKFAEVLNRKRCELLHEVENKRRKRLTIDEFKIMYGGVNELEEI